MDDEKSTPTHPGEMIRELASSRGITDQQKLADLLGVSRIGVNRMLCGKRAISPLMALRLEALFGAQATSILEHQNVHDLSRAYAESGPEVEEVRARAESFFNPKEAS